jgi:hypothetical protein
MLSRVTRLWTLPPCSGGLQFCHMPHGSGPCLSAQEGSGAITCLATLRGLHALTIKKGLADLPMQQDSRVSKTRLHVTEAPTRRGADGVIMTYKPCGQALQHRAIVHHRAADRSQTWRCSTTLRSCPLAGTVGRGYDSTGQGYARLRPNRTELRYRPLTMWQDRRDGARHASPGPSLPYTDI